MDLSIPISTYDFGGLCSYQIFFLVGGYFSDVHLKHVSHFADQGCMHSALKFEHIVNLNW